MYDFPMMARFNAWANEKLYATAGELPEAAYFADRGAFFGSIHRTLNHLLVVDRMWGGRVEGVDRGIRSLDQILHDDFAGLSAARTEEDRRLISLMDALPPQRLESILVYRRMIGTGDEEMRVRHVLITLFNHQTHHRGQVHALLTQSGLRPPPLDVGFFLEEIGESGPPGTIRREELPAGCSLTIS